MVAPASGKQDAEDRWEKEIAKPLSTLSKQKKFEAFRALDDSVLTLRQLDLSEGERMALSKLALFMMSQDRLMIETIIPREVWEAVMEHLKGGKA